MNNQLIPNKQFSSSSLINLYETGQYYQNYVMDDQYYPYKYDSWNERNKYGIIDLDNNVVYPKDSVLVEYTNNNNNIHKNINFVVDAFKDLKNYQEKLTKNNKSTKSIFTKLNVEKSIESVPDLYLAELKRIYGIFSNTYLNDINKKQILDISSFITQFIRFLSIAANTTPINRSSYIKSKNITPFINGLTISFDTIRRDADYYKKANFYVGNSEFDHFLATVSRFGFFVDKNFPYDIVADLESPAMRSYARARGYTSTKDIFENCYFKAYTVDIETLKNVLLSFWNTYASSIQSQIVNSNKLNTQIVYYNELTMETFQKLYNINWFIRLYLYIRVLEENLSITQNKFENLYQEAIKINKYADIENCTLYINQKLIELKTPSTELPAHLTTPDTLVRMLGSNMEPLPVEGINF